MKKLFLLLFGLFLVFSFKRKKGKSKTIEDFDTDGFIPNDDEDWFGA